MNEHTLTLRVQWNTEGEKKKITSLKILLKNNENKQSLTSPKNLSPPLEHGCLYR